MMHICKKSLILVVLALLAASTNLSAGGADDKAQSRYFYIDPAKGGDNNDGAFGSPWRSFANIMSYYKPDYRPPNWIQLKPGDCIYLMDGIYTEVLHPGEWRKGPTGGGSFVAYFRGARGRRDKPFHLKAYPGHKPVIDPQGKGIGISVFQSAYWDIQGIEVKNAYQRGISCNESKEIKLRDVHIHDTDGVDNNNIAGLYITDCWNVEVFDSVFNDNYDRTCADTGGRSTENSCNVVIFGGTHGGNITIRDCLIYNSVTTFYEKGRDPVRAGGGVKYKHASRIGEAFFSVHHNLFKGCSFFAFGSGTAHTHFHHNVILGPAGISSRDFGGVTHQVNQFFEQNVIYITRGATRSPFQFNPTIRWRNDDFGDDPKNIVFKGNIVFDTNPCTNERGTVTIGTYMSDETCDATITQLRFEGNSYCNPDHPLQFNIASGFNYKAGYEKGDTYSLKDWQTELGYDLTSAQNDPLKLSTQNDRRPDYEVLAEIHLSLGRIKEKEDADRIFRKWKAYLKSP